MKDAINLLIFSLDNDLSQEEQSKLEAALNASPELREEHAKLLAIRSMFEQVETPANPDFVDGVMDKLNVVPLHHARTNQASFVRLFPRVAAACIVFLVLGITTLYFTQTDLASEALVGIEDIPPEEASYVLLDY